MNSITFLLVGCGNIGSRHVAIISSLGKLLAVCDIDEKKASSISLLYETPYFTDFETMLSEFPQAMMVVVCTPNYLHAVHSIAALKNGHHVLCEKPMAISSTDCIEMMNVANACNKKLFVVKQNRLNPVVKEVKKILEEDRLGKIYSLQLSCFWNRNDAYYKSKWKGTKKYDGGTLFTQFSHFIDLLYWMFGDIDEVNAIIKNSGHQNVIEFEDNGVVLFKFLNGIIATFNFTINAYKKNMEGSLTIFGEKGTVKIGGQYLNELEYQQIEAYNISSIPAGNIANDYGFYQGSMSNHREVYEQIIDDIQNREHTIVTNSFQAFKTVEIIERIYAAAQAE